MNLGKFEILNEVGRGGFGTVYRANDTTLDRIVALKVLHKEFNSDQKFIESFKREARSMAKVSHPNVVQIFEVGELDHQIYIAMQFFDGGSLEQKIQAEGPLPLKEAIRMLSQVARGLEAGHQIGLIHRDIKPANILYNQNGYIAISDFGVVKSIQQGSSETTNSFNEFTGSPYYIPPEVWQSKANLSPAADVYSLACVLYEALTGEVLFSGETYEHVLTRHVLEAPVFSESLPENLRDLLSVALAKNPSDRHQTMNDFLMATRAALEGKKGKSEKIEPSGKSDVVNELPKPLAPGEITFDQLVRQAQRRNAPQNQAAKPAPQTSPVQPVIETKHPTQEPPKKPVEPIVPVKQKVSDLPTPSRVPPQPQSLPQTPKPKPSSANFRPLTDLPSGGSKKADSHPVSVAGKSESKDLLETIQQAYKDEPAQTSQMRGTQTSKKTNVLIPLFIFFGLLAIISVGLVYRFLILPSQANPIAKLEATQPPAPTTEAVASSYRKKDAMEMVYVPEGTFEMGSDAGDDDEKPVRQVFVDGYWIDKYEVTNRQYAQCIAVGVCSAPNSTSSYTHQEYFGNSAFDDYPVVHVSWHQAREYCQWTGGDLPTEAQWEKAARGTDSREYPWGNESPDYSRANYDLSIGDTTAVGSYPPGASPYGAMDMAGNVWEWVRDGFAAYGAYDAYNPVGEVNTPYRTIRGGNYFDLPSAIRSAYRFYGEPTLSGYDIGFRCILPSDTSELSTTKNDLTSIPAANGTNPNPLFESPTPTLEPTPSSIKFLGGTELVIVPAGSFMMGSEDGSDNEKPVHEVYLDAFYIFKYEVTNEQYQKCVEVAGCQPQGDKSSTTRENYYGNPNFAKYPVIYVNRWDAGYYCQEMGGALPTEAEWEKAARGTDGRTYPWGEELDGNKANLCDSNCELEWKGKVTEENDGYLDTAPVGSYPQGASPYGAMDMAGNVAEWVSDRYSETYYASSPYENPTGPTQGYSITRGGSMFSDWQLLRSSLRTAPILDQYIKEPDLGFRCVVPVENVHAFLTQVDPSQLPTESIGSTNLREMDGMEQVLVSAGSFEMGSSNGFDDEKPVHEVNLKAFYIDKYEVSNGQYEICVNAGQCDPPSKTTSATRSSYYGNPRFTDYPVIHINWNNARDYCSWSGGRLPTEAEWEKAARGTDGRKYTWGDEIPSCNLANAFNEATSKRCFLDTQAVGSFPENASPYGALDMAGNVWELVSDWYQSDYYSSSPANNPTGPSSGDIKVLRGGSWYYGWDVLRTVYRGTSPVLNGSDEIGFRCVSDLP